MRRVRNTRVIGLDDGAKRLMFAVLMLGAFFAPRAHAGDPATNFTLRDLDGAAVSLEDYRGKVIFIDFWATWCGPCKDAMPHWQKMYADLADEGLVVLAVTTDDARTKPQVKPFVKRMGYTYPVLYDTESRCGPAASLALHFDPSGRSAPLVAPPQQPLRPTLWRVPRRARSEAGAPVVVVETLEDAPFYARSLLATRLGGTTAPTFHESLSLDRFASDWVRLLLPFRMPRIARRR